MYHRRLNIAAVLIAIGSFGIFASPSYGQGCNQGGSGGVGFTGGVGGFAGLQGQGGLGRGFVAGGNPQVFAQAMQQMQLLQRQNQMLQQQLLAMRQQFAQMQRQNQQLASRLGETNPTARTSQVADNLLRPGQAVQLTSTNLRQPLPKVGQGDAAPRKMPN